MCVAVDRCSAAHFIVNPAGQLHSDCNEKILSLTAMLASSQQKLRECQANSADLENKYHKAMEDLDQVCVG